MSLPGSFSVSQTGAATYSIPIALAPATAGLSPSLSLDYSSQGANGLLGVGWTLGGVPSIGRCARTLAQDGVLGGVNFDANDRFCLDGQRLIGVSGTYGADGAEYRTEVDSYSRIISHGTAGTGPAWFEVRTKSGQALEFGHTTDSQVLAQGKTTARSWGLNKLADSKGNYLTVSYVNDATVGQVYPSRIDYTGNAAVGLAPYNSVQFVYGTRPDPIRGYHAGSLAQTTVRLTNVKTYAGSALVADYQISYQQSPTSNVSEINSIKVCAADGACLPAKSFQWANGGGASFSAQVMSITNGENFRTPAAGGGTQGPGAATGNPGFQQIFADFNGDGKSDIMMFYSSHLFGFLSNGDGTYTIANSGTPNNWDFGTNPASNYMLISGDFNGDGKSDMVLIGGAYLYVFIGKGDGTFNGSAVACPNGWNFGSPPQATYTPIIGDFDGDGRTDFLLLSGQYLYEFMSRGDGTFTGNTINIGIWNFGARVSDGFTPISGDFNGDGKSDFIMMGSNYLYEFMSNGDGSFTYNGVPINGWAFGTPPAAGFMPIAGDFNGDGKTDWVMSQGAYLYEFQSKGDGQFNLIQISTGTWNFGSPTAAAFVPVGGDFNGDGKADFALIGGSGPYIYQFISKGDGTFNFNTLAMPNGWNFGSPPTTNFFMFSGDYNGDGRSDFAFMETTHIYTVFANGGPGDVITGITSGLGIQTSVTYSSLTNSAVYGRDSTATYPTLELQIPFYVVSRVDTANGVGGSYSSAYTYAGAKADLTGRGNAGLPPDDGEGSADGHRGHDEFPAGLSLYRHGGIDDADPGHADAGAVDQHLPVQQCGGNVDHQPVECALPGVAGAERVERDGSRRLGSADGDHGEPVRRLRQRDVGQRIDAGRLQQDDGQHLQQRPVALVPRASDPGICHQRRAIATRQREACGVGSSTPTENLCPALCRSGADRPVSAASIGDLGAWRHDDLDQNRIAAGCGCHRADAGGAGVGGEQHHANLVVRL
ncbi:hypothetical protein BRAO375_4010002 [Bradyrhizobium sp. ORS 375]|nr:hypothetical protein BRAO375_4010002 [Bradyrhizobium sp. ORS 375]